MDPLHGDRLVGFRSLGERTFHEERLDRSATSARTWWRTGMRTAYSTSRTMSHRPGKCQTCICHSRQFETHPGAYYEPMTAKAEREPVHPQVVTENGQTACISSTSTTLRLLPSLSIGSRRGRSGSSSPVGPMRVVPTPMTWRYAFIRGSSGSVDR